MTWLWQGGLQPSPYGVSDAAPVASSAMLYTHRGDFRLAVVVLRHPLTVTGRSARTTHSNSSTETSALYIASSHSLQAGVDMITIGRWLGRATVSTTASVLEWT